MGYLDNSSVTIDAILTIKGRELLAKGDGKFQITKFALGDDEIDYTLWNTNHPLGTSYYGTIIENMPILEAVPDETQALRSKLVTLPANTTKIPVVSVGASTYTLKDKQIQVITPQTLNISNLNSDYICTITDSSILTFDTTQGTAALNGVPVTSINTITNKQSLTLSGLQFRIKGIGSTDSDKSTTVTISNTETGGSVTIKVTVSKITA